MKKNLILFFILLFLPINVYALEYTITSYDVDIIVNLDNSYDITETINVYFSASKHGIYRTLPLKNTVTRSDGTTYKNIAKVSNVSVSDEYDTYREDNNYVIQIGSSSKTLTGPKEYVISYTYSIGKDGSSGYDEFYYNIIGTEWDTTISYVTFTITFPEEFDESKLGFSVGSYGDSYDGVGYYVVDNVVHGYYYDTLNAGEGITIRLELPEGYFSEATSNVGLSDILVMLLPVLCLVIAIFIIKKYGKRKNEIVETVEFYPPDDLNSLDLAYAYKGSVNSSDVTSLLVYLANKGYLKIEEIELKKKKSFQFTKIKDYVGQNENEELFLKGLFQNKDVVDEKDLQNSFYKTMGKIINNINTKENKYKIYARESLKKKKYLFIMIVLSFLIIIIKPLISYSYADEIILCVAFMGFGLMYLLLCGFINSVNKSTKIANVIVGLIVLIFCSIYPMVGVIIPILQYETFYLVTFIIGLICILIMIFLVPKLNKRSEYGASIFGKIKGFKTFLEIAEKDKLEALVEENPTYFYDILPYTYVLDVSNKWISKFESINMKEPDWYDCPSGFDYIYFSSFINTTMVNASRTLRSTPGGDSSFSGGGFSSGGGGFSGGGSGGGGGHSW